MVAAFWSGVGDAAGSNDQGEELLIYSEHNRKLQEERRASKHVGNKQTLCLQDKNQQTNKSHKLFVDVIPDWSESLEHRLNQGNVPTAAAPQGINNGAAANVSLITSDLCPAKTNRRGSEAT